MPRRPLRPRRLALGLMLSLLPAAPALAGEPAPLEDPKSESDLRPAAADAEPWRLREAAGLPDWLWFDADIQTRYEYVGNQFRAGRSGDNHAISQRATGRLQLRFSPVTLGIEMQDARIFHEDREAPINSGTVNTGEILEAWIKLDFRSWLAEGSEAWLRAGRFTRDYGSRRLVARNIYRNAINAFTGVEGRIKLPSGWALNALATSPIQRRPSDPARLRENKHQLDREHETVHFWGLFAETGPQTALDIESELYIFGLNEQDSGGRPTRDRELYTPGFRVLRRAKPCRLDFELEGAFQLGSSRRTASPADRTNLQHRAFLVHAEAGWTFDGPWTPRVALEYDYASGDKRAGDKDNERFDTLFGARRFEFGPTGIYGLIARSNLNSPGLRVEVKPDKSLSAFFGYRAFWLADKTDAWVAAGIQDPTGNSGRFVGHQLEARVRWKILPGNLMWEIGGVTLIRGRFARTAPGANAGEPIQGYSQLVLKF